MVSQTNKTPADVFYPGHFLRRGDIFYYVLSYEANRDNLMAFDTKSLTDNYIKSAQLQGFQPATKAEFETALNHATVSVMYDIAINQEVLRECMEMKEILKEGTAKRFSRV